MNKYTFTDKHGLTWERVNRTAARRAYRAGDLVQLCPCNLRPDSMWRPVAIIHNDYPAPVGPDQFERYECYFTAYNCNDAETGRYPAYYVRRPFGVNVRAPRFSHGGPGRGYATADTIELEVNGRPVKRSEHPHVFHALADTINYKPGANLVQVVRGSLY
jgi:hypothetical protein